MKRVLPDINASLPNGITSEILYDSTQFVSSSIDEVVHSLVEAVVIVTIVVFLFLGSWRSVLIPVIAIPLSLIGTFGLMLLMGFSINLLTLLALVLAIGLVVDDAIIVVESVHRLIDQGTPPVEAAIQSARALVSPIIAMTVVLIAVYVPVGFQGGLTGALFTEFAFTLAGAVIVSAVIALTLSPMNCAWLLRRTERDATNWQARLVRRIDDALERLTAAYRRRLESLFVTKSVVVVFALLLLAGIPWLYASSKSELAPDEDQGVILTMTNSAPSATPEQRQFYAQQVYDLVSKRPETGLVFQIDTPSQAIAGWVLKPWDKRNVTTSALQFEFQDLLNGIAGTRSVAFQPPPLPGSNGLPIQFVIGTTGSFNELDEVARNFMAEALKTGQFMFLDNDLKIDKPKSTVVFDRDKAGDLGLKMSDLGGALATMLGGNYVEYFNLDGRSYKVIAQVRQNDRLTTEQLLSYQIRTSNNTMVPLATVAHLDNKAAPQALNHFQQINAATISGVAMPGVAMGDALATLKTIAKSLPAGYSTDFAGASRQLEQESGGFVTMFLFALIIIYLSLSALFNSFLDPIIILISVPMSLAGALIFISVGIGGASINI